MRIDKECLCCNAEYSIRFEKILADLDPEAEDDESLDYDEDSELQDPVFCPFCGARDDDEDDLED